MNHTKLIAYLRNRLRYYSNYVDEYADETMQLSEAMLDDADKHCCRSIPRRKVTRMLKSGYTCKAIADEVDCSVTTVQSFKRKLKLQESRERQ